MSFVAMSAACAGLCADEAGRIPRKVAKPVRVAVYQDPKNSTLSIARMLAYSPEYEVEFLGPEEYASGALENFDVVIQPGGGSTSQYTALGKKGVEALARFVRGGGKYYGVCAGAFMALQQSRPNRPRLGLVPFKGDDPPHYRGSGSVKIDFTPEGMEELGCTNSSCVVFYAGGPAAVPGEKVPDSDIKVFGRYGGNLFDTDGKHEVADMTGKAAFIGGRVGKGKVFLSCPHPESDEETFDIVRGAMEYLTGVRPTGPIRLARPRGAMTVRYRTYDSGAARFLFDTLLPDARFHIRYGKGWENLAGVDAAVETGPVKPRDIKGINAYIARGGRVVLLCDTPEKRAAAEKVRGAELVGSYAELVGALLAPRG